ncbi:MAG: sigma-70 family RNA polymerase sigma factor [Lawsonibacter sp.]|jgi:RNA polymerase sigma factor for flagellar operon FliA
MSVTKQSSVAQIDDAYGNEISSLDTQELMLRYKETGDVELKWALVLRFQDQIRRIALRTFGAGNGINQLEDVVQEGILTLLNAIDRFDPTKGVKLETFVAKRLRGMVIDLARKQDWLPRQLRQKSTRVNHAVEELSGQLGRMPEGREVADYLGISLEEYEQTVADTAGANLISFEMLLDSYGSGVGKGQSDITHDDPPEEFCEEQELHTKLTHGIEKLRPNEQLVLSLYYEKELTMKEIAQVLGISPPRVSQIHSHAIEKLRADLVGQMER